MAAAQIQYSAQVTRPQSNTSLVTGSMTGVGQILTTGRGQQAVVVGRGCSTSCLLHCPPLFAPPHCLPLPTRQPITRQSFKKGHRFYLPPMSAFNAVFCHQSVTFLQQEKKTFGDVEILKCRLCWDSNCHKMFKSHQFESAWVGSKWSDIKISVTCYQNNSPSQLLASLLKLHQDRLNKLTW